MRNAQMNVVQSGENSASGGSVHLRRAKRSCRFAENGLKNESFGCDLMQFKESKGGVYDRKTGLYSGFQRKNR